MATARLPILRLALANFVARRTRFALTIGSVALAVALVVAITSGYASVERVIRAFVEDFVGSVDFEATAPEDPLPAIPPTVVAEMRADPRVAKVTTRVEAFITPDGPDGLPIEAARLALYGLDGDPSSLGRTPKMEEGRFLAPGERGVIVLDRAAMTAGNLKLGDTLRFGEPAHAIPMRIVGVLYKPSLVGTFVKTAYCSIDDARDLVAPGRAGYVGKIRGEFNTGVDGAKFVAEWRKRLADLESGDAPVRIRRTRDSRADLDRNLFVFRLASYLGSTIGLCAAAFIILATLMTGVQEQRRQLAMLRAVGATKWQVGRLVAAEGVAIGVVGALVGVPLGIAGVHVLALLYPQVFEHGVAIDGAGAAYALIVAGVAAFVASLLPAILAGRARPVEAMAEATELSPRLPWKAIVAGLLLLCVDSLIVFLPFESLFAAVGAPSRAREIRLFGHFLLGLPTLLLGALLFAPLVVAAVEFVGRFVLAKLLRVPAALMKQQLSESPWRSAATGVSLMIGLMILIAMNTQARSALGAWKLPSKFPDVFIIPDPRALRGTPGDATSQPATAATTTGVVPIGIRAREVELIRALPQFQDGKVMPISVTAPTLGEQIFNVAGTKMPDKTLFIGIDPKLAFDLMELDFLGETPQVNAAREATAKRMLIGGRRVRLTDGTEVHGTIDAERADAVDLLLLDGTPRTIARDQITSIAPGRYLVVTNEFRKLRGYDVGSTFPLEAGLFGSTKVDFVIVGVVWSPGLDVMLNTFDLPARVREQTAATVFGTLDDGRDVFFVKDAFLIAANTKLGVTRGEVQQAIRQAIGRGGLNVSDVRLLKHQIETAFGRIVLFASSVAWAAMAVATLGVGNAIVAAVRARQWRLGVLRAVGLTRGELLRLLLAEAALLCVVGIILGGALGLLLATNANQLYAAAIGFDPPLILPWDVIARGSLAVLVMGLLATAWPAIAAARREPLSLLQAGRAAT